MRYKACLPNLFIAGAARSGTTFIYNLISRHPDVATTSNKEPHYFCRLDRSLDDYRLLFSSSEGYRYRIDGSTFYMALPTVAERIKQLVPNPKIIFSLRNPIDRSWSHYWWYKERFSKEKSDFLDAFREDLSCTPEALVMSQRHYYQMGRYNYWLKFYIEQFGRGNVFVVDFSDLVRSPQGTLEEIFQFLALDSISVSDGEAFKNPARQRRSPLVFRFHAELTRHMGSWSRTWLRGRLRNYAMASNKAFNMLLREVMRSEAKPLMPPELRPVIADYYRDQIPHVRLLTGMKFPSWATDFDT